MRTKIVYGPGGRKQFFIDGVEVTAEEYAKTVHPWKIRDLFAKMAAPGGTQTAGWPVVSEAMAVDPSQVAEANAVEKRHGTGVVYHPKTGNAIIPDQAARKKLMKRLGYFDKDAFN